MFALPLPLHELLHLRFLQCTKLCILALLTLATLGEHLFHSITREKAIHQGHLISKLERPRFTYRFQCLYPDQQRVERRLGELRYLHLSSLSFPRRAERFYHQGKGWMFRSVRLTERPSSLNFSSARLLLGVGMGGESTRPFSPHLHWCL